MPSIVCPCGERLGYGDIPNPIEWLVISDKEYDGYAGMIDSEDLYRKMRSILKCPRCRRLLVFWDGFESAPTIYFPEPSCRLPE